MVPNLPEAGLRQHGLARLFCDLFCVRDAVLKGDAAILQTLQSAVQTMNQNLQASMRQVLPNTNSYTCFIVSVLGRVVLDRITLALAFPFLSI